VFSRQYATCHDVKPKFFCVYVPVGTRLDVLTFGHSRNRPDVRIETMNAKPRLTRKQLGEHLRKLGCPIGNSTLVKLCAPSIGQGPPACAWWGNRPLYDLEDGIAWAEARLRHVQNADTAA
jgi:hypothetical protein